VTGKNLDLILKFLHVLPPQKTHDERERLSLDHTEFQIDELFSVPQVGTVVGGVIRR
jgi:GTPase